jgi:ABC-type nitrate/sulfonate/bicarbonate transport system substrate-binding protein
MTPTASTLQGAKFYVLQSTPGLGSAPLLASIDSMNGAGYTISVSTVESADIVIQGVASGQFQLGVGGIDSLLTAVEKGAKVQMVVSRNENEWTLYARAATVRRCADLARKFVALPSEGSASAAMAIRYVATFCPGTKPSYVIVGGANKRVTAMLDGAIDAGLLELSDAITIETQAPNRFAVLASFATDLPKLQTTGIFVNTDWAKQNAATVVAVIKAVLTEYRRIAGNADLLRAHAETYVKDAIDPRTVGAAARKYIDLNMFPVDGAFTADKLQYTADFFGPKGTKATTTAIPLASWTDISYLETALRELGPN